MATIEIKVYGLLNKHCPYIGFFHYSPSQSKNLNLFFADNVISMEEVERRKLIKLHPYTGNFHFAPGKYSDLHGLMRYRSQKSTSDDSADNSDASENEREIAASLLASKRSLDAKMNGTILKSKDDSSYAPSKKVIHRCLSDAKGLILRERFPSSDAIKDDSFSKLMSWNERHFAPRHARASDPTSRLDKTSIRSLQLTLTEWNTQQTQKTALRPQRSYEDPLTPPSSPVMFESSTSIEPPDEPLPAIVQLTEPKRSWQIHNEDGSNGLYVRNPSTHGSVARSRLTDKYEILLDQLLGEGSFARAYLGRYVNNPAALVAVKVINKSTHSSPEEEARFRREIDNQSRLWHHNVVTVRDVYESAHNIYIVLDYCPGGNLDQMLQLRRRLDEEETRFVAYQLFTGLAYIHENGVLHGDIKPANVMFQPPAMASSGVADASPSSGPAERVDLLFEKRRREGKLTITLNQAPLVDYDAVKIKKSSEGKSGGSPKKEGGKEKVVDLSVDCQTALLRERLVRGRDIHSVPGSSPSKPRRSILSDPSVPTYGGGGAEGFASAAHRNNLRKKRRANTSSGADLMRDSVESDLAYQGHIRYKCPYGMLLKICDFGLSQKVPDVKHFKFTGDVHKAPYTPGGTEGYLAPEVLLHKPYGIPADLWAVGTVLYKCVAGTLPFIPATSCLEKEVKFNGHLWKKISQPCRDLIASLLTVEEGSRPSARQCLNHPWFADILLISHVIIPVHHDDNDDDEFEMSLNGNDDTP
jgi:serine/threonine protein kinase